MTIETRTGERPRLLIVDDDLAFAATLQRMLQKHYEVELVHRAADALMRIRGGARFDCIVCAVQHPAVIGIELHESLAVAMPEQARAMVFLVSGALAQKTQAFAARMAERSLRKPFEVSMLIALIRAHLYSKRA